MYFEKCLAYDNKKCIALSQMRRNLLRQSTLKKAMQYLDALQKLPLQSIRVVKQPLFKWEEATSCFLYEILNIQHMVAKKYAEQAETEPPKESRQSFLKAMRYNMECIDTLRKYYWKDSDIACLDIAQENYHYSLLLNNAGKHYYSMYKFKENLPSIRRAYHLQQFGCHLWKQDINPIYERLTYLQMAKQLSDDQMGERLALINNFKHTPECEEYWKTWYQQNQNVYFKEIETKETIKPFTLKEAFQDLSKLISPLLNTAKD